MTGAVIQKTFNIRLAGQGFTLTLSDHYVGLQQSLGPDSSTALKYTEMLMLNGLLSSARIALHPQVGPILLSEFPREFADEGTVEELGTALKKATALLKRHQKGKSTHSETATSADEEDWNWLEEWGWQTTRSPAGEPEVYPIENPNCRIALANEGEEVSLRYYMMRLPEDPHSAEGLAAWLLTLGSHLLLAGGVSGDGRVGLGVRLNRSMATQEVVLVALEALRTGAVWEQDSQAASDPQVAAYFLEMVKST